MCLALTGKVVEERNKEALVDFGGIRKRVNSEFVDVSEGDEVLVFNNFIIERVEK